MSVDLNKGKPGYEYYLVPMSQQKYKKIRGKHGVTACTHGGMCQTYFTQEQIDKFPKYMRCGGKYGDFFPKKKMVKWNDTRKVTNCWM